MPHPTEPGGRHAALALVALLAALLVAACGSAGPTGAITRPVPGQLSQAVPPEAAAVGPAARVPPPSAAATARDYKRDAARHVYDANAARIHLGKLPPMLYAVGTLQVMLDAGGRVVAMHWLRAPQHAPEVIAEIERTVLAASPFPAATRLGPITWTDTWLWDRGGRFQLDTLSEGQQ
ncbi:MAG: hypothetical protein EOO24_01720 [Comamonadaceae bacterium]|nr:MAG: hypothetical protein EOO24_01720 [Comamonadaceae bacterium]